jgi:diguanylate cyclase (GGDEF)-like protein
MPETDILEALHVAERLRANLAARPLEIDGKPVPLTLSAGVASWANEQDHLDILLARADRALYRAKEAGRNRVCAESAT